MSRSVHTPLYQAFGDELSELLDTVLAGEVVSNRATAERLVRSVGALVYLHEWHPIDAHGRCAWCWPARRWWWPWPLRSTCSVHVALSFFLRQSSNLVLTALKKPEPVPAGVSRGRCGECDQRTRNHVFDRLDRLDSEGNQKGAAAEQHRVASDC